MNLQEKLIHNNKLIDDVLDSEVIVYFFHEKNNKLLVTLDNNIPSIKVLKRDLKEDIIRNKAKQLFGIDVNHIELIDSDIYDVRYYKVNFDEIYLNNNYKYVNYNN